MRRICALVLSLLAFGAAHGLAQPHFVSPLSRGILQVRGDHADLHLRATVPPSYQNFRIKLSSDRDTSSPFVGQTHLDIHNGSIDTLLVVPKELRNYTLYWFADSAGAPLMGSLPGLTPGHIIGIAGQSNAQGYCWEMVEPAQGDIRMLRDEHAWETAFEPTGNKAGGPWIVMANQLYKMIGDTLPVGIVNVAIASTGILVPGVGGLWMRNAANPTDSSIYGNALRRLLCAGSEIECLCWIQGENEAGYAPYLKDVGAYRTTFQGLMNDFRQDLADSFQVLHLQIGGWSNTQAPDFPKVHEAQRVLPPSTLVGTALGRSVEASDGVHYDIPTLWAVGGMFADAILAERYGQSRPMYPPLMPDSVAKVDSILDGSIPGRYCFSLGWTRGGKPVKLMNAHPAQCFALERDGQLLDTSQVWFRISKDSERVLLGLRQDSITLDHEWLITYNATVGADEAPLATLDPASGDTIFGTAFYELPVTPSSLARLSVNDFSIYSVVPSPTIGGLVCYVLARKLEHLQIELIDSRGVGVSHGEATVEPGLQQVRISTDGIASGDYWIVLTSDAGEQEVKKAVILH